VPKAGVPESFKVLIKELQSLCLNVKVLDENGEMIDLKQTFDDDDETGLASEAVFEEYVADEREIDAAFIEEGEGMDADGGVFGDDLFGDDDDEEMIDDFADDDIDDE
jgi:DNA-directed RNA polymerase subunit beta